MTNSFLQNGLMGSYKLALRLGVLRSGPGRAVYEWAYDLYKKFVEAKHIDQLAAYVQPGSTVLDIGANTGFFAVRFCQWVGPEGHVIAIEPEIENVGGLERRLKNAKFTARAEIIHAAAGDTEGEAFLKINPDHPGDHRLSEQGIPTRLISVDSLLNDVKTLSVSLIKIDVQGAETKTIEGARALLAMHRPALFIEIDDDALQEMGTSAQELLDLLTGLGYKAFIFDNNGQSHPLSVEEVMTILTEQETYIDCLFLPEDTSSNTGDIN